MNVFVKENHSLSRERCTVMTSVSLAGTQEKLEFIFKGKGTKTLLTPPMTCTVQWAPKGSYREEHLHKYIESLPTRASNDYCIQLLDNYSVHMLPAVRQKFLDKGYILLTWGGGVTGDIQINDTHCHKTLKTTYRNREAQLLLAKLQQEPKKIPAPTRDEQMKMISESFEEFHRYEDYF